MPLPIDPGIKVVLEQLNGGLGREEVVVRDHLAAAVRKGPDVLSEGGLPGQRHHSEHGCQDEAGPREHEAAEVDRAEHCPTPVLVAPAT